MSEKKSREPLARPTPSLSPLSRLTDGVYGRGFCRMVALTVRMELWSGSMFIGIRLFLCLLFLISFWDGGAVPKKTRHRIKGIPLSVWRVFFCVL